MEPRYKLNMQFQIRKVMVDTQVPAGIVPRENYTGEHISIESNMNLDSARPLMEVLQLIEQIQKLAETGVNTAQVGCVTND